MRQITDHIIMIRPRHFGFNPETAGNNSFQTNAQGISAEEIASAAVKEFDELVLILRNAGVKVDVLDDSDAPAKPDAVFPNNWFSTHQDGTLMTFPMFSPARRQERRQDLIDEISSRYAVSRHYSFEVYEESNQFLEGTGSLVLDRAHRIAYACLSERTDLSLVEKFCVIKDFTPVTFHAYYQEVPVYHTNVVMALGTAYVVICLECVPDDNEKERLLDAFARTQKEVIEISVEQMTSFAGNMIQLDTHDGPVCVMSDQAFQSLTPMQIKRLRMHNELIHAPVNTIEKYGGGSARCMIAENFLPELA